MKIKKFIILCITVVFQILFFGNNPIAVAEEVQQFFPDVSHHSIIKSRGEKYSIHIPAMREQRNGQLESSNFLPDKFPANQSLRSGDLSSLEEYQFESQDILTSGASGSWDCWNDGSIDPCHNNLRDISMVSSNYGWAVGTNGILLKWNGF